MFPRSATIVGAAPHPPPSLTSGTVGSQPVPQPRSQLSPQPASIPHTIAQAPPHCCRRWPHCSASGIAACTAASIASVAIHCSHFHIRPHPLPSPITSDYRVPGAARPRNRSCTSCPAEVAASLQPTSGVAVAKASHSQSHPLSHALH